MAGSYVAMPAPDDVAGQLRHLAQRIADGSVDRPARAVLVLYGPDGSVQDVTAVGLPFLCHREAINDLALAIQYLNAEASQ